MPWKSWAPRAELILEHIKSNPEEGSGVGSLLMEGRLLQGRHAGCLRHPADGPYESPDALQS